MAAKTALSCDSAIDGFEVAILGCGAVAHELYAPAFELMPELTVTACIDADARRAESAAAAVRGKPVVSTVEQLWLEELPQCEGILVSLPNVDHANTVAEIVDRGRHAFCEKPLALSPPDCDALRRRCDAAPALVVTTNHPRAWLPSSRAMEMVLETDVIGELLEVSATEGTRGGWNSRTGFQFQRALAGGGVLLDRGPHVFDLLVRWSGDMEVVAHADDTMGGCEATSVTRLRSATGIGCVVRLSKIEPWGSSIVIRGTRGHVEWSLSDQRAVQLTTRTPSGRLRTKRIEPPGKVSRSPFVSAIAELIRLWAVAARGAGPNPVPIELARTPIELIAQCYSLRQPLDLEWSVFPVL